VSWGRVLCKGVAVTKVKENLKGTTRMRHSRSATRLRGRTTTRGTGLLRRFLGSDRVGAPAETPAAIRVRALLARTQGGAASGTQAHAKLALEPALAAVSTIRLVLDVRAHCYKAVPLAPHLGSGAAPVETGVGRILRRLQASRQWHFQQLVVRDSNRRTSEARTRAARVPYAPPKRNTHKTARLL
jgi:hypothetical protein